MYHFDFPHDLRIVEKGTEFRIESHLRHHCGRKESSPGPERTPTTTHRLLLFLLHLRQSFRERGVSGKLGESFVVGRDGVVVAVECVQGGALARISLDKGGLQIETGLCVFESVVGVALLQIGRRAIAKVNVTGSVEANRGGVVLDRLRDVAGL